MTHLTVYHWVIWGILLYEWVRAEILLALFLVYTLKDWSVTCRIPHLTLQFLCHVCFPDRFCHCGIASFTLKEECVVSKFSLHLQLSFIAPFTLFQWMLRWHFPAAKIASVVHGDLISPSVLDLGHAGSPQTSHTFLPVVVVRVGGSASCPNSMRPLFGGERNRWGRKTYGPTRDAQKGGVQAFCQGEIPVPFGFPLHWFNLKHFVVWARTEGEAVTGKGVLY